MINQKLFDRIQLIHAGEEVSAHRRWTTLGVPIRDRVELDVVAHRRALIDMVNILLDERDTLSNLDSRLTDANNAIADIADLFDLFDCDSATIQVGDVREILRSYYK